MAWKWAASAENRPLTRKLAPGLGYDTELDTNQKCIFVFSTELVQEVDYSLTTQGRYAHSESYIRNLAQQNKFNILNIINTAIRTGIEGQLFVIQLECWF